MNVIKEIQRINEEELSPRSDREPDDVPERARLRTLTDLRRHGVDETISAWTGVPSELERVEDFLGEGFVWEYQRWSVPRRCCLPTALFCSAWLGAFSSPLAA